MTFLTITDAPQRIRRLAFFTALFGAFLHPDPRVITRAERRRGRASLGISGIRRFDFAQH